MNKKVFCLFVIAFHMHVQAAHFVLSDERINSAYQYAQSAMDRCALLRKGVFFAAGAAFAYWLIKPSDTITLSRTQAAELLERCKQCESGTISLTVKNKKTVWSRIKWFTAEAAKFVAMNAVSQYAYDAIAGVCKPAERALALMDSCARTLWKTVFNKGDLAWFTAVHTDCEALFEELDQATDALDILQTVGVQDLALERERIVQTTQLLLGNMERVIGFMRYRADVIAQRSPVLGQQLRSSAALLYRHTNIFVDAANKALATATESELIHRTRHDQSMIKDAVIDFKRLYQSEYQRFHLFEGAVDPWSNREE